jgi:hypothetical protein
MVSMSTPFSSASRIHCGLRPVPVQV